MVDRTDTLTAAEFDAFVALPQNAARMFEYIGGAVVEVPSNPYASKISQIIAGEIYIWLRENDNGHLTGEAGGYQVAGERYAPDVGYISKTRQPEIAEADYNPNPPDLAVEVDFPSIYESQRNLRIKIANYVAVGTTVWLVLPEAKRVEVYQPGQPVQFLGPNDTLDGGDILPGFRLPIHLIFPD